MEAQEVKAILGNSRIDDTYVNTVLPLFIDAVKVHCNNKFESEEELPGGVKIALSKWIELSTLKAGQKSRGMGEVSYSYDTTIPRSITLMLAPYRRMRVK